MFENFNLQNSFHMQISLFKLVQNIQFKKTTWRYATMNHNMQVDATEHPQHFQK